MLKAHSTDAATPQTDTGTDDAWRIDAMARLERDQAARTFLRMVSHELRTPLNSIIGFSEILSGELYGPLGHPQYVEYAGIIRDSGRHLLSLFNNVLDIMRLETGSVDINPVEDTLLPWLRDAADRARDKAELARVSIDIGLTDAALSAVFDPRALTCCLGHLLDNALQHTAAGDHVLLDARSARDTVEIAVFNRGPAPMPVDIPRLMLPFEQGHPDDSGPAKGAGLGWAIVRLTMKAMGGDFRVITRPGESLSAILVLPGA